MNFAEKKCTHNKNCGDGKLRKLQGLSINVCPELSALHVFLHFKKVWSKLHTKYTYYADDDDDDDNGDDDDDDDDDIDQIIDVSGARAVLLSRGAKLGDVLLLFSAKSFELLLSTYCLVA